MVVFIYRLGFWGYQVPTLPPSSLCPPIPRSFLRYPAAGEGQLYKDRSTCVHEKSQGAKFLQARLAVAHLLPHLPERIPLKHSVALGFIIPIFVSLGRFTLRQIEQDLGIRADRLQPGRGRTIESLKSYLFTAPIVFHYLRWFLKWGDL